MSDLELTGADLPAVSPSTPFAQPCGAGPPVFLDGKRYETSVAGTYGDVVEHRPLPVELCWPDLELAAGDHELKTTPSSSFVVQDLWLLRAPVPTPRSRDVRVLSWDATSRSLSVDGGPVSVLSIPENANPGWVATVDGRVLERTRVDGWQQAWRLPAGGPVEVRLDFVPDRQYRFGLLVGGLAVLAALLTIALPVRRRAALDTAPGGSRATQIALAALVAVLGGMPAVIALLTCLLARALWRPAPRWIALVGGATAAGAAFIGRLAGQGQDWAYAWPAQGALLLAVAAVVAACLDWPVRDDPAEEPA
ncbi:hypothetical protein ACFQV2_03145 [Actinokineospora soli]|uniref:Uncharacterized protein n=1 Tax=Actinokineospora soli TaxID=1048753 RepID=A0ABW2TG98_9PSEU